MNVTVKNDAAATPNADHGAQNSGLQRRQKVLSVVFLVLYSPSLYCVSYGKPYMLLHNLLQLIVLTCILDEKAPSGSEEQYNVIIQW